MVEPTPIPVTLSSSSVFSLSTQNVFGMAADLGYDGVEIMVTQNHWSQDPDRLNRLAEQHDMAIHSIHAPTLLFTQQVWGSAWNKIARSVNLAKEVGAELVVVHPPFRWQGNYARDFVTGIRDIMEASGVMIAVENMYPWKVQGIEARMYLPDYNPLPLDYDYVTWDFSHAASAGTDSLSSIKLLGDRLKHVHVTDGTTSGKDDHLLPGEGVQPVAESLQLLGAQGYTGAVCAEVGTRKARHAGDKEQMLAHTLQFTRENLRAGQIQASSETTPPTDNTGECEA